MVDDTKLIQRVLFIAVFVVGSWAHGSARAGTLSETYGKIFGVLTNALSGELSDFASHHAVANAIQTGDTALAEEPRR